MGAEHEIPHETAYQNYQIEFRLVSLACNIIQPPMTSNLTCGLVRHFMHLEGFKDFAELEAGIN